MARGLERARLARHLTVLNPAPVDKALDCQPLLRLADCVTPNEREAEALTGLRLDDERGRHLACRKLQEMGCARCVLTLGAGGLLSASASDSAASSFVAVTPVRIVDTRDALGLGADVDVNPSGGALCGDPVMATGLVRIIEAAQRVADGTARRAVAHAANGQALQHNLVCVLEGAR